MPSRSDVVLEKLEELQEDLLDLWHTLRRDPKREVWKERAWAAFSGVFAALAALAARRAATKVYGILTGERPPVGRQVPPRTGGGPSARRVEETEPTTPTAA
jgi:L-alanine-DL-glutamate epimerase-like enolase superfamily enzyme